MKPITLKPADLSVEWQGVREHETQRGRTRAILTGIPGAAFWYAYKHNAEFKSQLREAQIAIHRVEKGKWEVILWINHRNAHLVESLGFSVPSVAPVQVEAF